MADTEKSSGFGWNALWEKIKGSSTSVTQSIPIPPAQLSDVDPMPRRIESKNHYFSVVINEMFLAQNKQFLKSYDPLVFSVCEFTYKGQPKVVPFVVGPSLISKSIKDVPGGLAITDTQVAGLYPYAGGKLAITIILAQVETESTVKQILQFAHNLARAFPAAAMLESHLKVAGILFDAVETLLGLPGTKPLIGHRWEYDDNQTPYLTPGYFALIKDQTPGSHGGRYSVSGGRLFENTSGAPKPYRETDFVLYSLLARERRNDIDHLPFYYLFDRCLVAAGNPSAESWGRAKAGLVALLQEMITSPDLTWIQARELIAQFKKEVEATQKLARDVVSGYDESLSIGPNSRRAPDIALATGDTQRDQRLGELHELLSLEV